MMVWTQLNYPQHKIQCGDQIGAFMQLTWDATNVAGVTGNTYDATNHVTTNPLLTEALITSGQGTAGVQGLFEQTGIRKIRQVVCLTPSSSANVRATAAGTFSGSCTLQYSDFLGVFLIFTLGAGNAGAGTDPLTAFDPGELNNATSLANLTFRMLVIGR